MTTAESIEFHRRMRAAFREEFPNGNEGDYQRYIAKFNVEHQELDVDQVVTDMMSRIVH